jgi:hypothetical protein
MTSLLDADDRLADGLGSAVSAVLTLRSACALGDQLGRARASAELCAVGRLAKHPGRCDCYHLESPCAGQLYSRWCVECGEIILRCDQHGGIRGAAHAADLHHVEAHPGSDAEDPEADDPGRVPGGGQALPLGELPAPPAARGRRDQGW